MKSYFCKAITFIYCLVFLTGCSMLPMIHRAKLDDPKFRRMPYEVDGKRRMVDIFYATSREIKGKATSPKSYTSEISSETSYGTMEISIKPGLKIGTMLPGWYKRKKLVRLEEIQPLENEIFMQKLNEAVNISPRRSLLITIFGFKDKFEYMAIESGYFAYLLDINTPVLFFDWPNDQSVTPWGYFEAEKLAKRSGAHLARLLTRVIHEIKPDKLWIQGSSLGCQVVCEAFEEMYKNNDLADAETEIDHVVLSAPDVAQKEFNDQFKKEILALSDRLTTYVSSNDKALLMSGVLSMEKKLGRQHIKIQKHEQFEEARDILYLKSLNPDRIEMVDVTPINDASFGHGYYLESSEYFDDLFLRLVQEPQHVNRRAYLLKNEDETDYWVLYSGK